MAVRTLEITDENHAIVSTSVGSYVVIMTFVGKTSEGKATVLDAGGI